jgi:hypothetical protein
MTPALPQPPVSMQSSAIRLAPQLEFPLKILRSNSGWHLVAKERICPDGAEFDGCYY